MRYYLCDFCQHDTGPFKPQLTECCDCQYGCNFKLVNKMYPKQAVAWNEHKRLDEFVDSLGVELLQAQRLMLHTLYNRKRPLYFTAPKDAGLSWARLLTEQYIDALGLKPKSEKEKTDESNT